MTTSLREMTARVAGRADVEAVEYLDRQISRLHVQLAAIKRLRADYGGQPADGADPHCPRCGARMRRQFAAALAAGKARRQ